MQAVPLRLLRFMLPHVHAGIYGGNGGRRFGAGWLGWVVDRSIGRPISHSVNRSVDRSVGKAHAGARSQVQVAFFSSIGGLKLNRKLSTRVPSTSQTTTRKLEHENSDHGSPPQIEPQAEHKSTFNFTDDKKT